jgi:hypothetical protein
MKRENLKQLLHQIKTGLIEPEEVVDMLITEPYTDMGWKNENTWWKRGKSPLR